MASETHLLFVWSPSGYQLVEREGELPALGSQVELDGRTQRVCKVATSPLPGDNRPCVYLQG